VALSVSAENMYIFTCRNLDKTLSVADSRLQRDLRYVVNGKWNCRDTKRHCTSKLQTRNRLKPKSKYTYRFM
jgi:hypothetical protein